MSVGPNGRMLIAELNSVTSLEIMTTYVGQSLAVVNSKERAIGYSKKDGTTQLIKYYNDVDKTDHIGYFSSLGHCNGMCYVSGYFYVCSYYGSKNTKRVTVVNASTLKKVRDIILPVA